jgi:hypothetical protein
MSRSLAKGMCVCVSAVACSHRTHQLQHVFTPPTPPPLSPTPIPPPRSAPSHVWPLAGPWPVTSQCVCRLRGAGWSWMPPGWWCWRQQGRWMPQVHEAVAVHASGCD